MYVGVEGTIRPPFMSGERPAMDAAPRVGREFGGAVLRWSLPSAKGELHLDPDGAEPLLIPAREHGASLAAALLEALDRSASSNRAVVEARRGQADLTLVRAADWPLPARVPSETLAGQTTPPIPGRPAAPARGGSLGEARAKLGDAGVNRLEAYPRRRRALGDERRKFERLAALVQDEIAQRRRAGTVFAAAGGAALVGAAVASAAGLGGGMAATSALLAALGAGGFGYETVAAATLAEDLAEMVARARRAELLSAAVEEDARRLARGAGGDDPLRLAERLTQMELHADDDRRAEEACAEAERRALGERLAERLDVPSAALADESLWSAPRSCDAVSWPPDVAVLDDSRGRPLPLVGMARLLQRVERELPRPWPIVLWEPWAGASSDRRAQRLMALSQLAVGRRVVALVRA